MDFRFPVTLAVAGRRCVVVGGGPEADRRARVLVDCDADVTVLGATPLPGLVDLDRRGQVILVRRHFLPGDLAGAFLVVVTEPEHTEAVFAEAELRGVLCHAADDPAHCHFVMPSVLRRGELTVAVSTGGRAPALAKRVRHRLEDLLSPEYATLLELLAEARAEVLAPRTEDFPAWAARWQAALSDVEGLLDLLAEGRREEARRQVQVALAG